MPKEIRTLGGALSLIGILVLLGYAIPPLRGLWPWFRGLPGPVQLGIGAIVVGFALVVVSLLMERLQDRAHDQSLRND